MYDTLVKLVQRFFSHPLYILFFITVVFRLWFAFSHLTFGQDFARDIYVTQESYDEGVVFVGYGPKASVGDFYLPPFYYQLLLLLRTISSWPLLITAIIAIVESATPILLFYVLKEFLSRRSALLGAFIYAFSGLAVTFGTFAWNPNMIPFFTTLSILFIHRYLIDMKSWKLSVGLLSAALAFHLHYQVAVLLPFFLGLIAYLLLTKKFQISHWLIAISIAVIPFLPYLRTEVLENFANTKAIVKYFSEEHANYYDRVSKVKYIATYLPSFIERELTKTNAPYLLIGRILFAVGMITFFKITIGKKTFIYFLYFASIFVSLRLYKGDKLDYYLATLFIFPSILIATIIEKYKRLGISIGVIAIAISLFSLSQVKTQNQFADLRTSMEALEANSSTTSLRLIVHEINFANTILFGLSRYTQITVDQNSLDVLDVCGAGTDCMKDKIYESKAQILMNDYTQKLRISGDYHQEYTVSDLDLPFDLHFGKFTTQPADVSHPLSSTYNLYGSDLLDETIFQ